MDNTPQREFTLDEFVQETAEQREQREHLRVIEERRQVPETEDELLALQEEFFKSGDRPAARAFRVIPPSVKVSRSSEPPPLEKDVVSLENDNEDAPPTVQRGTTPLRPGSRFLQRSDEKGPRYHFQSTGQKFELDLENQDRDQELPVETEQETHARLNKGGAAVAGILSEVLENPAGLATAPTLSTTSQEFANRANRLKPKGKSLFAQRMAGTAPEKFVKPEPKAPAVTSSKAFETLKASTPVIQETPASPPSASSTFVSVPSITSVAHTTTGATTISTAAASTSLSPVYSKPPQAPTAGSTPRHSVLRKSEMEQIDKENREKLAQMDPAEIEEKRAELLRLLDPAVVERLMKRGSETPRRGQLATRRVSFSANAQVEGKVVSMEEAHVGRDHSLFEARRHSEEEGDHPVAIKRKYYPNVPSEPEKLEWMGFKEASEGAKPVGKSVTPGIQPYDVQEADPEAAHYRFDFSGKILPEDVDAPVHLGLHHHGVDPTKAGYTISELLHLIRSTVPSQRIIPLNTIAKIFVNCHSPTFATSAVRTGILRWLVETLRAPVYLRAALDDKTDSGIVAAINALASWVVPNQRGLDRDVWDSLEYLDRGYETVTLTSKYQATTLFAGMELKHETMGTSHEQGTELESTIEAHAILAAKNSIAGLLAMNILPRLKYLLEKCQLPDLSNSQILDLLLAIARHDPSAARQIYDCEGLVSEIFTQFISISWPSENSDIQLGCTIKAIKLINALVTAGKSVALELVDSNLMDALLRFLVISPPAIAESEPILAIQAQVFKLYRSLGAYGLHCNVLGDSLQSHLLQDTAQAVGALGKAAKANHKIRSMLTRKLSAFLQLLAVWTHAAADVHRTTPEHAICWAQPSAFLDLVLDALPEWTLELEDGFNVDQATLVCSAIRFVSTWTKYLSTNPPDSDERLSKIWKVLGLENWQGSNGLSKVRGQLAMVTSSVPEITETVMPHLLISLSNPSSLGKVANQFFELSLCCDYLASYLNTIFHIARLENAPEGVLQKAVQCLISENIIGIVDMVTKYELAIQERIPVQLPPWLAFFSRHGVYLVSDWLTAMDVLIFQQDPEESSRTKIAFFPLFQETALSLLQMVQPGDEFLSHNVLANVLFHPRVLDKLLSHNTNQVKVVERILKPLYMSSFIKNEQALRRSKSMANHDGRGIQNLFSDYGSVSAQPLFSWLFYPIEILYKSKLTYVEESGTMIAATSVAHCVLDFVHSLMQTLSGISFELVYIAALKVLKLEGEREPEPQDMDDDVIKESANEDEEDDGIEVEDDGFLDQEVIGTIDKVLDHFSSRGDSDLVRNVDFANGQGAESRVLSESMLSALVSPLPFHQFMKDFLENSFVTGAILQAQATGARFLFPAMAISTEYQSLIWVESYDALTSVTTKWDELDPGTLRALISTPVTPVIRKQYLKALLNRRVIKARNPALYWIAIHHLAKHAFEPLASRPRPSSAEQQIHAALQEAEEADRATISNAIVSHVKGSEVARDWLYYDERNFLASGAWLQFPPQCFMEKRRTVLEKREVWLEEVLDEAYMERLDELALPAWSPMAVSQNRL